MENNRNLFLTIALSVAILSLWQIFYVNPRIEEQRLEQAQIQAQTQAATPGTSTEGGDIPAATVTPGTAASDIPQTSIAGQSGNLSDDREAAVSAAGRIAIETDLLTGSINLVGARFDDLSLKNYHVTNDDESPIVDLLTPAGVQNAYFGEFGYTGFEDAQGPNSEWTLQSGATLTPSTPVTLTFDAPNGLTFTRTIAIDDGYMFSIDDQILNNGAGAISLQDYGRTTRFFKPEAAPIFILHEGMVGVTGETGLTEYSFSEIEDDGEVKLDKSTDGWLGITDKYWATALIPTDGRGFQPRYQYLSSGTERYQSDFLADPITVNPGQTATVGNKFFAGAKKTEIIDAYEADLGIRQFELMIDWGWFHFITKPLFVWIMFPLFNFLGNFGVAILMTTVIVKAVFFPLASKSYASMARMKVVQPQMAEIKEKYGEDR
ncbi:MAG: membrane protein insertase YidC, partial [Pseudomonadota bacterium]